MLQQKYPLFSHIMDKNNYFGSSNDIINITFQNKKKKILRFKQFRKKKKKKKKKNLDPCSCVRGVRNGNTKSDRMNYYFLCASLKGAAGTSGGGFASTEMM